ncbi:MAG: hypothetical protein QG649_53 [Patescibacteria group bacterium]|nr:hypothetical protein [Patescibacteria group bacterium]
MSESNQEYGGFQEPQPVWDMVGDGSNQAEAQTDNTTASDQDNRGGLELEVWTEGDIRDASNELSVEQIKSVLEMAQELPERREAVDKLTTVFSQLGHEDRAIIMDMVHQMSNEAKVKGSE